MQTMSRSPWGRAVGWFVDEEEEASGGRSWAPACRGGTPAESPESKTGRR